ncbi:SigB/SigF/SigG family RNA polymerase sigma factor [Acidaminobacterium chupaoyuni]
MTAAAEQRSELIARAQQGQSQAMQQLVEENSPLIWSIVRRYFGRGVESDDLYQLGCIGFLKAVQGFDSQFETQFSTYAVPKIAGEIRRFLRDDGIIKVSRTHKENQTKVNAARARLSALLGREPYLSEIAAETGLTPEEIAAGETATQAAMSLDASIGEDGPSLMDLCAGEDEEEKLVERLAVKKALSTLPEKEKAVISLRYFRDLTQQQTAEILKISQVQVSRLEHRAFDKIRKQLRE